MRTLSLIIVFAVAISLSGCDDKEDPIMPDVVGQRLDVALSNIEQAGFRKDPEVLGGGLLGIVDESNWEVCEQTPEADQPVTDKPRLVVERSCVDESNPPEETPSPPKETPSDDTEPGATDAPTEDEQDAGTDANDASESASSIDADAIEAKFKEHLQANFVDEISDMCDESYTHWACFYDGVESPSSYLNVILTTDGGWPDSGLEEMAASAGRHWFNFIGCDYPNLNTIVVTINGLDHNVFRSDTAADTLCS